MKSPAEHDQTTEFVRPMTPSRRVDIKSATQSNPFIAPQDGYVMIEAKSSGSIVMAMGNAYFGFGAPAGTRNLTFVKKGTDMYIQSEYLQHFNYAFFIKLN